MREKGSLTKVHAIFVYFVSEEVTMKIFQWQLVFLSISFLYEYFLIHYYKKEMDFCNVFCVCDFASVLPYLLLKMEQKYYLKEPKVGERFLRVEKLIILKMFDIKFLRVAQSFLILSNFINIFFTS
jgi:hypothetical protein